LLHSAAYDPDRWQEFRRHYTTELQEHAEELQGIRRLARQNRIMPVYAYPGLILLHFEALDRLLRTLFLLSTWNYIRLFAMTAGAIL